MSVCARPPWSQSACTQICSPDAGLLGRWVDDAGTVAWIVVLTNSFNLLDNMDGAAAGIALGTGPFLALLALATGRRELAVLLIAVMAGCAGFLVHNWAPARIFMGDSGSLFLGYVLATSALLTCATGSDTTSAPLTVAACALLAADIRGDCGYLHGPRVAVARWPTMDPGRRGSPRAPAPDRRAEYPAGRTGAVHRRPRPWASLE